MLTARRLFAFISASATFALTAITYADVVLDQENVLPIGTSIGDNSSDAIQFGQTLTVGVTGTLVEVQVYLSRFGPTTENLVFQLYATSAGLPTTQLGTDLTLAPAAVSTTVPDFESFDVSGFALDVTAGDVLAFVITKSPNTSSFGYILPYESPGTYAGGQPLQRILDATPTWEPAAGVARDYGFRTFVDEIPEPASLALLGVGLAMLGRRREHSDT